MHKPVDGAEALEIERLRAALIAMGRMLPGVVLHDQVSTDFLCKLPGEMGHYRLVAPSRALAEADLRLAGVKEGLEMAAKVAGGLAEIAAGKKTHCAPLSIDTNEAWRRVEDACLDIEDTIRSLGPRP